jgi:hypothetical protein
MVENWLCTRVRSRPGRLVSNGENELFTTARSIASVSHVALSLFITTILMANSELRQAGVTALSRGYLPAAACVTLLLSKTSVWLPVNLMSASSMLGKAAVRRGSTSASFTSERDTRRLPMVMLRISALLVL